MMKTKGYLLLFLFGFLMLQGCKTQTRPITKTDTITAKTTADLVTYAILKDSIFCKSLGEALIFTRLEVLYPDKKSQNKANNYFLNYGDKNFTNNNLDSRYNENVKKIKDTILNMCDSGIIDFTDYYGGSFFVDYAEHSIISTFRDWNAWGFPDSYFNYYNFNLKEGNILTLNYIFNDKKGELLKKINALILESLKDLEFVIKEDYSDSEEYKVYLIKALKEFIDKNQKDYVFNEFPEENWFIEKQRSYNSVKKGINFNISINPYGYPNRTLIAHVDFFSFEELEPYLSEEFKKQIDLSK